MEFLRAVHLVDTHNCKVTVIDTGHWGGWFWLRWVLLVGVMGFGGFGGWGDGCSLVREAKFWWL